MKSSSATRCRYRKSAKALVRAWESELVLEKVLALATALGSGSGWVPALV
jgi:hypothetical protein